ncbi:hypothetical protein ACFODL_06885 [Phenylobacterium terrae]|uniref:DUF4340 domain-containing protein n=1 Tax=Phenylobacterium terrae TaxID=2665495 RepID=A0ABW4N6Z6_9CAUL
MTDDGAHTLSREGGGRPPRSRPALAADWIVGIFCVLGLIGMLGALSDREPPVPEPPGRTASFYATLPDGTEFVLRLTGGKYRIRYIDASDPYSAMMDPIPWDSQRTFRVDFNDGSTLGPEDAHVYIIHGKPNLHVGAIGGARTSETEFVVREGVIVHARFSLTPPQTGPPPLRTIVLMDGLGDVTMEGFTGESLNALSVLEFDAPLAEQMEYFEAKEAHDAWEKEQAAPGATGTGGGGGRRG